MTQSDRVREVRWERLYRDELEARFAACPVAYFSYGLCEPHGPQNTLGLDGLKAHAICCEAAREHGGIVAPPDYWHIHEVAAYASWGAAQVGEARPWLTAVPPWIHFKNVCYQIRAAEVLGFEAAILLTGHYGPNWKDLKTLVELVQPHFAVQIAGLPDFEANDPGFDGDGASGDHAGKVETSLLWALEPECVDLDRLPVEGAPPPQFAMGATARESSREVGARMVRDEVAYLGELAGTLRARYTGPPRQMTFSQVEQMWTGFVAPRVESFESMKKGGRDAPALESRWAANQSLPGRCW